MISGPHERVAEERRPRLANLSRRIWIDSISAKRTQFEGAGVEAIDKIFVRHPALLEGSIGPGPRRPGEIASLRRPQPNIVTQIPA
jgi:hypothetical protein